jgi:hypothetical protein
MSRTATTLRAVAGVAAAGAAALSAYILVVRPWHRRWGATDEEVERPLPGDELVSEANFQTTRAIDIEAPPEQVWPWLVQIGQGRGGFYSYDVLENAMGLDIHSADRIVAEYQDLAVGDEIAIAPEGGGFTVVAIEPQRHLLLEAQGAGDSEIDAVFRQADAASTWLFLLEARGDNRTRLIVRWRARWGLTKSFASFLMGVVLDPIEFLMEQKMMRGIKERAEAAAQHDPLPRKASG